MRTKEDFGPSDYYYQLSREIYELNHDYNEIRLNNKFIKFDSDFDEIKNIEDDYLIIIGHLIVLNYQHVLKMGVFIVI